MWKHPLTLCVGDSFSDRMYRTGHENVGWLLFMLEWLSLKYFFCISCCSIRSFHFPCNMESLRALHITRFLWQGASKRWNFGYYFLAVQFHLNLWFQYSCLLSVLVVPYLLGCSWGGHVGKGFHSISSQSPAIDSHNTVLVYPLAPSSQESAVTPLSGADLL